MTIWVRLRLLKILLIWTDIFGTGWGWKASTHGDSANAVVVTSRLSCLSTLLPGTIKSSGIRSTGLRIEMLGSPGHSLHKLISSHGRSNPGSGYTSIILLLFIVWEMRISRTKGHLGCPGPLRRQLRRGRLRLARKASQPLQVGRLLRRGMFLRLLRLDRL